MGLFFLPFLILAILSSMFCPAVAGIVTAVAGGQRVSVKRSVLIGAVVGLVFYTVRFISTGLFVALFFLASSVLPGNSEQAPIYLSALIMPIIPTAVTGGVIAAMSGKPHLSIRAGILIGGSFGLANGVISAIGVFVIMSVVGGRPLVQFTSAAAATLASVGAGVSEFLVCAILGFLAVWLVRRWKQRSTPTLAA